ncbi:hypothetical protein DXG01_003929 [Tephrocybe rancida]|nr:hypothetical protein DXG01_003929 [Tephrocybe rancida]
MADQDPGEFNSLACSTRAEISSKVAAVMFFDTVHQILISHTGINGFRTLDKVLTESDTVYIYTITNYNNPEYLANLVWSMLVEVLFNVLDTKSLATPHWWLANLVNPLYSSIILRPYGSVSKAVLWFRTFVELQRLKYLSITVNALAAAGDVLIAMILCTLLHRSRTGFHRLCAVASLISITIAGKTFLYIAFFFCIGRLYSNSLLATLNARKMIRGSADGIHSTSENISLSLREFPKNGTISSRRPTNISIKINTTKEFVTDSDQGHDEEKGEPGLSTGSTSSPSVSNVNQPEEV